LFTHDSTTRERGGLEGASPLRDFGANRQAENERVIEWGKLNARCRTAQTLAEWRSRDGRGFNRDLCVAAGLGHREVQHGVWSLLRVIHVL
jgi:hypothetical protein